MEIELRVEIKQQNTFWGLLGSRHNQTSLENLFFVFVGVFVFVFLFVFGLFLWAFDSSGLIQINADYSNPNRIRFILPKAFLSSHY